MLPTLEIVQGLHRDILIEGPGLAVVDFSDFVKIRLVSSLLGLTKESDDPLELQVVNGNVDLNLHLLPADTHGKQAGAYPYRVSGVDGSDREYDLFGVGFIRVLQSP